MRERRENARAHFWRFQNFSFLFFFLTKRLDSLFETPLFTTYMRSHMRVVVVLDYYLPTRFSTTTTTNNNNEVNETKESTSEKSGEREDGFEGRERRTFGVVFEDS